MSFLDHVKNTFSTLVDGMQKDFVKVEEAIEAEKHSHTHLGEVCHKLHHGLNENRFHSFAPPRTGNDAKWFVDGCGYMWAVSVAIEEAKESIWILDWWLSPELYLRRPPSQNENYRIDRMLLAAAERGVKVNIIVYKEVAEVLTREFIHHSTYGASFSISPARANSSIVCSEHTKKALEIHPNIAVFRHPDHAPSGKVLESEIESKLKNFSLSHLDLRKLPSDSLKALYGMNNDVILYWAHHEKLCLIDGTVAFMGGLDLCFGRWDPNSHPLADAHPTDVNQILFPGQDFNNARVYDFQDVTKFMDNKLDRTKSSRMGWSDLSICIQGPVVEDLRAHFVQRWNFIYDEKYDAWADARYKPLILAPPDIPDGYYRPDGKNVKAVKEAHQEDVDPGSAVEDHRHHFHLPGGRGSIFDKVEGGMHRVQRRFTGLEAQHPSGISVQLARSCTRWSNGVATEVSQTS